MDPTLHYVFFLFWQSRLSFFFFFFCHLLPQYCSTSRSLLDCASEIDFFVLYSRCLGRTTQSACEDEHGSPLSRNLFYMVINKIVPRYLKLIPIFKFFHACSFEESVA